VASVPEMLTDVIVTGAFVQFEIWTC